MASYPPPAEIIPVFNPSVYQSSSTSLTIAIADARYLQLSGGILRGSTTFQSGLSTPSISNAGNVFSVPSSSGQLALFSQIPSTANFVDLSSIQTITGKKTFSNNPIISAITNGSFNLIVPTLTANDTIALISQIPSTSNFVTLTGVQTISGVKTFSTNPIISAITNGSFNLNIPTLAANNTIALLSQIPSAASFVDLVSNQTIAGLKTFSSTVQINSGDISIINGRVSSTALGTASLPCFAIGTALNDGIYSIASGLLGISTAGVQRLSLSSSVLTLVSGVSITCSGTSIINSGSNGYGTSGAYSTTITSSNTNCAIRPSGSGNTGIFGTASALVGIAVGGITIISCTSSNTILNGTASISGISTLTGGSKIGTSGTTTVTEVRGTISYSTVLAGGVFATIGYVNFTGGITFASIPNVIVSITNNSGANYWDQCQVAISQVSTTQLNVGIRNNNSSNSTAGSATINYIAWI